ncbi:MAG: hypothetical protein QXF52_12245 [Thermoproteota archaeon]
MRSELERLAFKNLMENESVRRWGDYLRALVKYDYAYDAVDRIAKSIDKISFSQALYRAARMGERVSKKANEEGESVYIPSNEDTNEILRLADENLKMVSNYLGICAFSYFGGREK